MEQSSTFSKELFTGATEKFKDHLQIENNERLIFSGKFGHGKTTFLSYFFDSKNQIQCFGKEKYKVIKLFPVNYSIASNEDIFRYIKYDIIYEMLNNEYPVEATLLDELKTIPKFLVNKAKEILATLISFTSLLGKEAAVIGTGGKCLFDIVQLYKNYCDFHKTSEDDNSPENELIKYINDLEQKDGSIYEYNLVSQTISKLIDSQKKNAPAEVVLVIDDLDRIDPEHIFRILNVFAAHFDKPNSYNTPNKFGFDKIILVCDVENIRNIFKAKYGISTDFNGYIDKFYSTTIFNFNIKPSLKNYVIDKINQNKLVLDRRSDGYFESVYSGISSWFLYTNIEWLMENKQISLRNLNKLDIVKVPKIYYVYINDVRLGYEEFPLIPHLVLLSSLKGDYRKLINAYEMSIVTAHSDDQKHKLLTHLLYLLTIDQHKNRLYDSSSDQKIQRINFDLLGEGINVEFSRNSVQGNLLALIRYNSGSNLYISQKHLIEVTIKTIEFLHSNDVI